MLGSCFSLLTRRRSSSSSSFSFSSRRPLLPHHHLFAWLSHTRIDHHTTRHHNHITSYRTHTSHDITWYPATPLRVAGAVLRASRRGCGAPGRRWPAAPLRVTRAADGASHDLITHMTSHHLMEGAISGVFSIQTLQKVFCGSGSLHSLQDKEGRPTPEPRRAQWQGWCARSRPFAHQSCAKETKNCLGLVPILGVDFGCHLGRRIFSFSILAPPKNGPQNRNRKKSQRWQQHFPGGLQWSLLDSIENPICP